MRNGPRLRRRLAIAVLGALAVGLALAPAASAAFERLQQYGIGYPVPSSGAVILSYGVGVAPDGTVVVGDAGADRVAMFAPGGKFLQASGKKVSVGTNGNVCTTDCRAGEAGTGPGELSTPWGVAAGPSEAFVAEIGANRVSVFDYSGHFLRAFGADVGGAGVNVCTTSCAAGTAGFNGGMMASPSGVALDGAGNVYVAELGTARVDVFTGQGQFQRAFGKNVGGPGVNTCTNPCTFGVADGTPGSINSPMGLSISPGGDVYVAEQIGRVSVFNAQGQFLRTIGSPGSGAGQLAGPWGVTAPGDGGVYVADTANNRMSIFGEGGDFRRAMGLDVIPGPPVVPEVCTTLCKTGTAGYGIGEFAEPRAMASDCRGDVYIAELGRVEKWGDPAAGSPPCPPPPPPPAQPASAPSNEFAIGKQTKNKKKGTLTIDVTVPGAGSLSGSAGRKISVKAPQPAAAGVVKVNLKAVGAGLKALNRKGKLKGRLSLTFTPSGGSAKTKTASIQLVKRLKKKAK